MSVHTDTGLNEFDGKQVAFTHATQHDTKITLSTPNKHCL